MDALGRDLIRPEEASSTVLKEAGKQLAVWLFCIGATTLRDTQAAFDRHPEWRSA
jgi:hypothetical protein